MKEASMGGIHMKTGTKIFFTDLDGTLLNSKKQVTPATREALERWTLSGNRLVLCSGRAIDSVRDVKDSLGLTYPGMYLAGCNGSEIYDCEGDRTLSRITLPFDLVSLILEAAKECGVHCHTYTDTHIISPADNEALRYYCRVIHTPVRICEDVIGALDKEPCKCIAIEIKDLSKLERFRKALLPLVKDRATLLYSSPNYLEIFSADAGKGSAVVRLCGLLNIPVANSLAAGDEANDISMLEAAGYGIAMKNARDEVKKKADVITEDDNDHDGLAPVLLKLL